MKLLDLYMLDRFVLRWHAGVVGCSGDDLVGNVAGLPAFASELINCPSCRRVDDPTAWILDFSALIERPGVLGQRLLDQVLTVSFDERFRDLERAKLAPETYPDRTKLVLVQWCARRDHAFELPGASTGQTVCITTASSSFRGLLHRPHLSNESEFCVSAECSIYCCRMTDHDDSGIAGLLAKNAAELNADHETVRGSKRFQDATKHLRRIAESFLQGIQMASIASTRDPASKNSIILYSLDDLVESAVAIPILADSGIFGSLRRDLRYMLETAVKLVFVDQQHKRNDSLDSRIAFFDDTSKVPRSSIRPIDDVALPMLPDPDAFRLAVKSTFADLSGFVHPSKKQVDQRRARLKRGEYSGYEGPIVIEKFNDLSSRTLDMVFTLVLHGIGVPTAGDIFTVVLDDEERWKFHKTKYTSQVSAFFDYKVERKSKS